MSGVVGPAVRSSHTPRACSAGRLKRPRRVSLDRVHRCSFLKNSIVDDCVQLVFLRPPTTDARAGNARYGFLASSS